MIVCMCVHVMGWYMYVCVFSGAASYSDLFSVRRTDFLDVLFA